VQSNLTYGLKSELEVIRADALQGIPWLVHGFSTRRGGVSSKYGGKALNLGFTTSDSRGNVESNRRRFRRALGVEDQRGAWPIVGLRQIHSDLIHLISEVPEPPLSGDGLITATPSILLTVLTADCLPIVVVDLNERAAGVFHAGWRGTLKRIVEKGVGEMRRAFGSNARNLRAAIGPGIRDCCYEVQSEVRDAFAGQFRYAPQLFRESQEIDEVRRKYPLLFLTARAPGHSRLPGKMFLDLAAANRRQLVAAGVPEENISDLALCTSCRADLFFSHRRERGVTGRMMAAVGIKP
jgi:polyphenol oxidase